MANTVPLGRVRVMYSSIQAPHSSFSKVATSWRGKCAISATGWGWVEVFLYLPVAEVESLCVLRGEVRGGHTEEEDGALEDGEVTV